MPGTKKNAPILVTGGHRSGTTWVGQVLAQAPGAFYVHEPFNPKLKWTSNTRLMRPKPFKLYMTYIHAANQNHFTPYLDDALGISTPSIEEWLTYDYIRKPRRLFRALMLAREHAASPVRTIMKDPVALLSAEWLADHYGMPVVITIRHPAAFVDSVIRKNWRMRFERLTIQPRLIDALMPEMSDRLHDLAVRGHEMLENATVQWLLIHHAIRHFQQTRPDWNYLRHEDASVNPQAEFKALFEKLGLTFNEDVRQFLAYSVDPSHGAGADHAARDTKRDAVANLAKWKRSLPQQHIDYIREQTDELAQHFYPGFEW